MKKKIILPLFIFIFCSFFCFSQQTYKLKQPQHSSYSKCKKCIEIKQNLPQEVRFSISRDDNDNLFFVSSHIQWFEKMFKKGSDGIAIDIVTKSQFDCSSDNPSRESFPLGTYLPPVYYKDMKKNGIRVNKIGNVAVPIGKLPAQFRNKEIEFNVMYLRGKNSCNYNIFYNIQSYRWNLLDMGMYMDTLTFRTKFDTVVNEQERFLLKSKRIMFTIPFEVDKSDYSPDDIKPVYDSLNLKNYDIKNIEIKAYSSVEGTEERNIELQESRAQSIVDALRSYQKPSIITKINVSENWVEFLGDVIKTPYADLAKLSKHEIKQKLLSKEVLNDLEPYLQNHRKAIVILDIQEKNSYIDLSEVEIREVYEKSIEEKNLENAISIQKEIFDRILGSKLPKNFINELSIPEKEEFAILLVNRASFKYFIDETDVTEAYKRFQKLEILLPKDKNIKYNLCALKFRIWLLGDQLVDAKKFEIQIKKLSSYGIDVRLVKRMLINFHIIQSEIFMYKGEFQMKDRSVKFIFRNYKQVLEFDKDYLNLAQYFTSYAKYKWGKKLLKQKLNEIDVHEDILFYYINLTIVDKKENDSAEYRTIMLNAFNSNKKRFCEIFNSNKDGGVSFQLLNFKSLKKTYCESCD